MQPTISSECGLEFAWPMRNQNEMPQTSTMTDEQAMWLVQTNADEKAFTALVQRWERPIFRLCARMLGDAHRGEDLKQEAFSRVFAKRKEFQMGAKFSTWLWRIALNLCYDELRRKQRHARRFQADTGKAEADECVNEARVAETPYLSVVRNEEGELVRQALLHLDEKLRTVIVLRYCEGLKLREIADLLETPLPTIQSRVATGLARLTGILHPDLVGEGQSAEPQRKPEKQ